MFSVFQDIFQKFIHILIILLFIFVWYYPVIRNLTKFDKSFTNTYSNYFKNIGNIFLKNALYHIHLYLL